MTFEKASYITGAVIGTGTIMGGVWFVAVATTNLNHNMGLMNSTMTELKQNYQVVASSNNLLSTEVATLKKSSMSVVYADNTHVLVRLYSGALMKIKGERIDAGQNSYHGTYRATAVPE